MNLHNLIDIIKKEGGASYSLTYGNMAGRKGYAVSPYKDREEKIPLNEFSIHGLQSFVAENAEYFDRDGHFLGAWVENEIVYLDVSVFVAQKTKALKWAKENGQLAIYSFTEGKTIYL